MADKGSLADLRAALEQEEACADHPPLRQSQSPEEAELWWDTVQQCSEGMRREHLAWLGRNDLFFLLVYLLNRKHFIRDAITSTWTFSRCREVQAAPNNHLDIWPRESFKSEIITFGLTIQDILNDPEVTFGFFSHTRPIATKFVRVIKLEFQTNELLKEVYPDICWQDPQNQARNASARWSDLAITVKRKGNPKEATIEAWGLVDGQPTSARFKKLVYDDVVARSSISPDMIHKTDVEFSNSLFLTASDPPIVRYIATFQEIGDTTQNLIDRHFGTLRLVSPFDKQGKPAFCSEEKFAWIKQNTDPKSFALQILLDPKQSKDVNEVGFNIDWMEYYDEEPSRAGLNVYVLVDPAGNGPESNSYFAMWVLGLGADKKVRVLDMAWDRYDLEERWEVVAAAVAKYDCLKVGYEKYGMQSDIEHIRFRQKQLNNEFTVVALGGGQSKDGRIAQLIPWFKDKRFIFPKKGLRKRLKDGTEVDLVRQFIDREMSLWPYSKNKDMLDALARICDPALNVVYPRRYGARNTGEFGSDSGDVTGSWMSG